MKKISMILAALMLLSMSLNAQLKTTKDGVVVQPNTSIEKVDTPPDGYFRMGPSRASTTPVTPPYSNDFGSSTLWNWWEVINANNDGSTYTWTLSSNTARYRYNSSKAADDWLVTAPITLEAGKTYKFYIDAWAQSGTSYPERLEVKLASTNTASALTNGTTIIGQTTVSASSSSPQHLSNENITVNTSGNYYIGIHAISDADMYYLYVDNFVIDVAASVHDLSIALSAPANVGAGGTATLTATVTNTGNYAESGYTVTFRDGNNNVIDSQTGGSLAVGASTTFTTTYTTTAAQAGQTVNFTATVTCNGDEDATNNNATASTSVITLPPPENVAAMADDEQSATMTWDAPIIASTVATVTEDFENTSVFPPFSVGGITATQHTGAFGDWTLYDSTGANVYGFQNAEFENSSIPHAWQVFNPTTAGTSQTPHSGNQFMLSVCPLSSSGKAADHWLISPELSGNAQTINFYVAEITTSYGPETYEIWVSTTDNNHSHFSKLGNSYSINSTSWSPQSVNLPAGTKYFAIVHTSNDIFGLMVDDITYERVVPGEQPTSYNIYLDGVLVGNVNSDVYSYTFNNLTTGQHNCGVSAVYTLGESAVVTVPIPEFAPITSGTVSPTSVDFGTKSLGGTYTATVTVTNTGNQPFTPVINITNLPGVFTVTGAQQVSAHGTLNLSVTFTPTDETNYSGSFTVTIPVPDGDDIVVTVTVTGAAHNVSLLSSNTTEVIPVFKSDIEMGAPYTKDQVDDDDMMMELTPNIATGTLNVKVKNESAIKRYEINRGLPSNWSVVAIAGHQGNYFTPYDGDGVTAQGDAVDVSSTGTDYTWITVQDNTAAPSGTAYYVPVTVADGKVRTGNTYGAMRLPITVALGSVSATVEVDQGGENEGSTWEINGVEYCVYIPVFEIAGTLPNVTVDGVTYEPYMFRAWRKGSGAYEVTRDYNDPLKPLKEGAPLGPVSLLAQRTNVNSTSVTIGDQYDEESPDDKPETAFAAPYVQDPDISFVVRFYYKRVIDNGESPAGMRRSPVEEGEYYIAEYELEDTDVSIVTAINELFNGRVAVETTYVNALGQQSSQPFDGVNIVITRYNDGTVTTSKVLK